MKQDLVIFSRFKRGGSFPLPEPFVDRNPLPETLTIIQGWTFWDLKVEIDRLDKIAKPGRI